MDIGSLSVSMNQSALSTAVSLSVMKLSMNTGNEIANTMTQMLQNCAVDQNRGRILDVRA